MTRPWHSLPTVRLGQAAHHRVPCPLVRPGGPLTGRCADGPDVVLALEVGVPVPRAPAPGPFLSAEKLGTAADPVLALLDDLCARAGAAGAVLLRPRGAAWTVSGSTGVPEELGRRLAGCTAEQLHGGDTGDGDDVLALPVEVDGRTWGVLCLLEAPDREREAVRDGAEAALRAALGPLLLAERLRAAERAADTDTLTGLGNRRAFDERAGRAFQAQLAGGPQVAVLVCDLNGLKAVNDRYGHAAGDRLLVAVGEVLRDLVADLPGALAVRLGGDEFAAVLVDVDDERVLELAETCCALVAALPDGGGLSCGVATTDSVVEPVASLQHLLRLADAAQYRAKRAGSLLPVLAGRTQLPAAQGAAQRHRSPLVRALAAGVSGLCASEGVPTLDRLQIAAEAVRQHLDPGGWWLSHSPRGSGVLCTVASADVRARSDHQERVSQAELGAEFDLREFPRTAEALRGGSFVTQLGAPDNDPAEEHTLVISGFTAMAAAGASDGSGGWLLEVFLDELSEPLAGLDVLLRALVELAVRGHR